MKSFVGCVLATCLSLAAPLALAEPPQAELGATFLKLCGETHGDAPRALAVADQEGWTIAPATTLHPPTFGPARWADYQGRVLNSPVGLRVLAVGTLADPGGHSASSCAVIDWRRQPASTADMALLRDGLTRWVGGDPVKMDGSDFALFAFRESGGKRIPLSPSDPALAADVPPASVAEVMLTNALGKPMITYVNWR